MDRSVIASALVRDLAPIGGAARKLTGSVSLAVAVLCFLYAFLHILSLNFAPIETWTFRILHICGGLGLAFLLTRSGDAAAPASAARLDSALCVFGCFAFALVAAAGVSIALVDCLQMEAGAPALGPLFEARGWTLCAGVVAALICGWSRTGEDGAPPPWDLALGAAAVVVALYVSGQVNALQYRAGVLPTATDAAVASSAIALILECTRRLTGWPLVAIACVFLAYGFGGQYLPGVLGHSGYAFERLITYLLTDNGVLGPTVSVSSTYLVVFVVFAAFLQVTGVGEYFVRLAFGLAGRARGGPAKVAVLGSALMGMINGSSAANVVATGAFTIPLMKRVGYPAKSAGAVEAAASTGGQLMPPVMGAGAFIMAEITGIPYQELLVAAILPSVLYFASIYFMVDFEAARNGMSGLSRDELPNAGELARHLFLLAPIAVLICAMFAGYSVIRAGSISCLTCAVLSLVGPQPLTLAGVFRAFRDSSRMLLQLVVVCACAGIVVGVIGLTGVGLKFSAVLLSVAESNQMVALAIAMGVTILLGMGMPTTAAYAIAASVVAPGLVKLGVPLLTAHLFVFYYAVVSAITPPVALAGYAAAGVAGTDPLATSVRSFAVGFAAFLAPLLFYLDPGLLMEGSLVRIVLAFAEGVGLILLLAGALQGWLLVPLPRGSRALLLIAIALLTAHGWLAATLAGGCVVGAFALARMSPRTVAMPRAERQFSKAADE